MLNIGATELILVAVIFGIVILFALAIIYALVRKNKKND